MSTIPGSLRAAALVEALCDHTGRVPRVEVARRLAATMGRADAETAIGCALIAGDIAELGPFLTTASAPLATRTAFGTWFIARGSTVPYARYADVDVILADLHGTACEPVATRHPSVWRARCAGCWTPAAMEIRQWPAGTDMHCCAGCPGHVLPDAIYALQGVTA
jgi:hypothetical protein